MTTTTTTSTQDERCSHYSADGGDPCDRCGAGLPPRCADGAHDVGVDVCLRCFRTGDSLRPAEVTCDHFAKSGDACQGCGTALPPDCGIDRHEGDGQVCWTCFRPPYTQKDCDDYLEALLEWADVMVDDLLLGVGDVVRLHPADGVDSLHRFIARRPGVLEDVAVVEKLSRGRVTLRWSASGETTCVSRRWVTTSGVLARRAA